MFICSGEKKSILKRCRFSLTPEISLCCWSFLLNFFWEVIQTYFYTLKDSAFHTMLYGWLHCTFGDVIITIVSFWAVSILSRSRRWFLKLNPLNYTGFILIGLVYTFFSEMVNVQIFKSWNYNEYMPIVPWMKVGLTPVLQWLIIPSIAILFVRRHLSLNQEALKRREEFK